MAHFAPGLLFISAEDGTDRVEKLMGRTFHSIADGGPMIIAVCNDGLHGVSPEGVHPLTSTVMSNVSSGAGFIAGIDTAQSLYTWGPSGFHGQLGHGACHQHLSEPTKMKHSAKFTSVACGDAFSLALDDKGGAYSWGENFDKQLGLYTKTVKEMHLANAMVEDLSFVPRLIPLSLSHPVIKVACGLKFALVITKGGVLYSWGAGECGQLGTGRCTQREVPAPVMLLQQHNQHHQHQQNSSSDVDGPAVGNTITTTGAVPLIVRDVACGAAHVVAVSEDGALYSWGLNKCCQLGIEGTRTQHSPARVEVLLSCIPDPSVEPTAAGGAAVVPNVEAVKVYCNGHSSAAIDRQGRLFTWGSTANNRLMHRLPLQKKVVPPEKVLSYSELRTLRMGCAKGNVGHFKASRAVALKEAAAAKAELQLPVTHVSRPTLVVTSHLKDCAVQSFSFASTHSAALVLSCLKKAWPSEGPRRSFSKLQLFGDGFWDAPNIVVKFTFKQATLGATITAAAPTPATPATSQSARKPSKLPAEPVLNPPRSCSGRFINTSTLQCKPPKFSEAGVYTVSISMDGTTFLQDTVEIYVHQELTLRKQLPELLDLSAAPVVNHLELQVAGLPTLPLDWQGSYHVRLLFSCLEGVSTHSHIPITASSSFAGLSTKTSNYSASEKQRVKEYQADFQVETVARLLPPATRPASPSAPSKNDSDNEDNDQQEGGGTGPGTSAAEEASALSVLLCEGVDLSEFQAAAGRALFEMRCQVSINGQDFSSLKVAQASHHKHHRSQVHQEGSLATDSHTGGAGGAGAGVENPPSTLVYAFTAESILPSCLSIDSLNPFLQQQEQQQGGAGAVGAPHMDVVVKGSSFLPTSRLPKNAHVFARILPVLPKIQWQAGFTSQLNTSADAGNQESLPAVVFPVRCESTSSLTVGLDIEGLALFQELVAALNALACGTTLSAMAALAAQEEELARACAAEHQEGEQTEDVPATHTEQPLQPQRIDLLPLQVVFELHLPDHHVIPLSTVAEGQQLLLNLYRNQPLQVVPNYCSAAVEASLPYTLLVNRAVSSAEAAAAGLSGAGTVADGFGFHSSQVQVAVHVPRPSANDATAQGEPLKADQFYPPIFLPSGDVRFLPLPAIPAVPNPAAAVDTSAEEKEGQDGGGVVDDLQPGAGETGKFILQVQLQPLSHYQHHSSTTAVTTGSTEGTTAEQSPPYICISCWLDGVSEPPTATWSKLHLYRNLCQNSAINPPPPKTGFVPGSAVTLDLPSAFPRPVVLHPDVQAASTAATAAAAAEVAQQSAGADLQGTQPEQPGQEDAGQEDVVVVVNVPAGGDGDVDGDPSRAQMLQQIVSQPHCMVRLRGAPSAELPHGAVLEIAAQVSAAPTAGFQTTVAFEIPDNVKSVHGMLPVQKTPKDKAMYFVDVSMDGGLTFNDADVPLLFLK